jgi:hypothetical protein
MKSKQIMTRLPADPTPAEILAKCETIRAQRKPKTWAMQGVRADTYTIPEIDLLPSFGGRSSYLEQGPDGGPLE